MARGIHIAAALLCIICILALCIAPSVDIPQTTLKSLQIIFLLMIAFMAGVFLFGSMISLALRGRGCSAGHPVALVRTLLPPMWTSCVQQC